jgi:hypothetical protein
MQRTYGTPTLVSVSLHDKRPDCPIARIDVLDASKWRP